MSVRILLADDHSVLREGLRTLLAKDGDFEVVAEANNGREAVRLANELKPDVVLMDISMPDLDGIEATRCIHADMPDVRIIGLSMHLDPQLAARLLGTGASGFLAKTGGFEQIRQAIRAAMAGQTYIAPDLAVLVAEACIRGNTNGPDDGLTSHQLRILQLYAAGLSTKEIAIQIHRSIKTVEMHRLHIQEKLKLRGIADMTKYAIRKGLISPEN
jgi:two-component system, NarL family, response regulator NreC